MRIFNMVVISRKALNDFAVRYPVSGDASLNWFRISAGSDWSDFQFRLIVRIIFPVRTAFIRWIGTHAMYNKLDVSLL